MVLFIKRGSASEVSEICVTFRQSLKCHEVDRNRLNDFRKIFVKYAVDLNKNILLLGWSLIFQMYVRTVEI